ncbi:winged helix-turn-helix transcriptional regulator [Paenarthrobacter sp. Z7-10]|nr:winged helix-turn-helix transcriptional regulator [Paenarthrobacter sp. Z7-10]
MPDMDQWPTGRLLSTAARLVEHAWNERLATIGVTHAGIIALDVLAAQGPMTQARLAGIIKVQAQTMGKTLARMESHGHVQRVRNAEDRRSHLVSLTDAGRTAITEAHSMEEGLLDSGGSNPEELRGSLRRVIRSLADSKVSNIRPALSAVPDEAEPRRSSAQNGG